MTAPAPLCIVRADAHAALGGGHVVRCLTLAAELHRLGWRVVLAASPETADTMAGLLPPWAAFFPLSDGSNPNALMGGFAEGCDVVIVDHYQLDEHYERPLRGWAKKIVAIDDLADRKHDCDVLVDQTLGRDRSAYAPLVPALCNVLAGSPYMLLRGEFARLRFAGLRPPESRFPPKRVVVFMGLGDAGGHTLRALDALVASGLDASVDVFLGHKSPSLPGVLERAKTQAAISVHLDAPDIAAIVAAADLAIGNAGSASWERCCLALPSLALVLADNQTLVAKALADAGAALVLDVHATGALGSAIRELAADPRRLAHMSVAAAKVCDGLGAARAAMHIAPVVGRSGDIITSRPMAAEDGDRVFAWQTTPGMRRHMRNPKVPTRAEHDVWMRRRLGATGAVTEIIVRNGRPAGLGRLDPLPGGAFEVTIVIASEHQGAGVGTAALTLLRRLVPFGRFNAQIYPGNAASTAAFARAGYRESGGQLILDATGT